jgi:Zn-dependent M28 family amino/carboxypeptidase
MGLPATTVGEAYVNGVAWDILQELVAIGDRHPGHDGERSGAEVVEEWFSDVGLRDVRVDTFDIQGWWRGSTSLTVHHPTERTFDRSYELLAHPGTTSSEVTAPLVDVGYGVPEEIERADVEDAIVVASSSVPEEYGREVSRMEKYVRAADAEAAAFVFRTHAPGALPPTGSNVVDRIPSVGVSKEVGTHLKRYCSNGQPEATLTVESRINGATSQNVQGCLGPDTDREVLVTAHVDSHDINDGARDNGVGSALVVETARLLASIEDALNTKVRFLTFGAEEIGLVGATHFVKTTNIDRVKCVVNVDAAGQSRSVKLQSQGFDAIETAFERVTDDLGVPLAVDDTVGPGTDAWAFVQQGVPAVTVASSSEETERLEVEPGRGWGHTHADTIDKLDRRDLRDLAVQLASAVVELTGPNVTISHKPLKEIRTAVAPHRETVLRGTDSWPFQ